MSRTKFDPPVFLFVKEKTIKPSINPIQGNVWELRGRAGGGLSGLRLKTVKKHTPYGDRNLVLPPILRDALVNSMNTKKYWIWAKNEEMAAIWKF